MCSQAKRTGAAGSESTVDFSMSRRDFNTLISSPLVLSTRLMILSATLSETRLSNVCKDGTPISVSLDKETNVCKDVLPISVSQNKEFNSGDDACWHACVRLINPFLSSIGVTILKPSSDLNCAANPLQIEQQSLCGYIAAAAALPPTSGTCSWSLVHLWLNSFAM